jgi:hypothetical protein
MMLEGVLHHARVRSVLGPEHATRKPQPSSVLVQRFSVPFEYPIHFTRDMFRLDNPLFRAGTHREPDTDSTPLEPRCFVAASGAPLSAAATCLCMLLKRFFYAT